MSRKTVLCESYTFDDFEVTNKNKLAYTAAQAIAVGEEHDPLIIYGKTGTGKTHLLHAIGNHIIQNSNSAQVAYINAKEFAEEILSEARTIVQEELSVYKGVEELIDGIQVGIDRVIQKYSAFDVLLVDDLQYLAHKEKTKEAFVNLYGGLIREKKRIVMSIDRSPYEYYEGLQGRLYGRLQSGLVVEIW